MPIARARTKKLIAVGRLPSARDIRGAMIRAMDADT